MSPDEYKQYHRDTWEELAAMAAADNVKGFFARYAEYLEKSNIISTSRILLHRMSKRVSEIE